MDWWAEKQIELFDDRGIEPWQSSCWCHTHPKGIDGPSNLDEETMQESFGGWDMAIMLILTKGGVFYARIDFTHDFVSGISSRFSSMMEVDVDHADGSVLDSVVEEWEREFHELVKEAPWPKKILMSQQHQRDVDQGPVHPWLDQATEYSDLWPDELGEFDHEDGWPS